jgi:hypothetical protein
MTTKFVLPALVMGITCLLAAILAFKTEKKYGVILTLVNATVLILLAIEWLYIAGYFIFSPEKSI